MICPTVTETTHALFSLAPLYLFFYYFFMPPPPPLSFFRQPYQSYNPQSLKHVVFQVDTTEAWMWLL